VPVSNRRQFRLSISRGGAEKLTEKFVSKFAEIDVI
jgi:hypothetical protein